MGQYQSEKVSLWSERPITFGLFGQHQTENFSLVNIGKFPILFGPIKAKGLKSDVDQFEKNSL